MKRSKRVVPGFLLIALGALILLANLRLLPGELFLITLGLGFLAAYFLGKRNLGFLIPGAVLTAIGLFAGLEARMSARADLGPVFLIFLGAAFITVYLVHTSRLEAAARGARRWPLIPGGILMTLGIISTVAVNLGREEDLATILDYWPAVLILLGVIIILRGRNRNE